MHLVLVSSEELTTNSDEYNLDTVTFLLDMMVGIIGRHNQNVSVRHLHFH
jgi:hypothetical protein